VPHAVPNAPVEVGDGARMFRERTVITVGGREWTLWLGTMPVFDAEHDRASPVLAVCGGALISILLALVVWGMGTGRARALALAQTMTADLALAKDRAEGALRETEALRSTVDHHSIVSVADVKGRIIEVNDALCRISGYAREELLGQDHRIFNSGHHPKSFWVQMWRTIAGGQAWREEVCNRAKNGSLYWVDSIIAPFKGADGSIEKYISLRTDITERKRADQELVGARDAAQAANRAKSEFLANMSHEIRTPMTAILGYAALLMEDPVLADNPPKRRECLTTMKRNGEHLLAVINDILDLSRIEADKLSVEKISVAPAAIVEEVLSAIRVKASEKKLALDTVWETPVPAAIATDPVRLRQVLVNLLGNAVKFTESGGVRLGIACEPLAPGGGALRFTVTDTGIGMTPEQMGRVFNAFEQADTTMSRRFGGTGLGLRIARSLARMLGGDIAVASEPDAGSTFTLTIATGPLDGVAMIDAAVISQAPAPTPAAPQEPRLPHPAAPSLAGLRVLLAEDGPDNQRLIAFHLRKAGAQVAVADNGLLAVRALCAGGEETGELTAPTPFDLILMDMQMPAMDGYTAVAALRAKGCTLPIIALTAHAMTGDKEKCLAAGCDDYASKPIDKALLLAKVAKWNGVRGGSRAVRAAA
jgi:PAS domain S-box-containing protein